MCKIGDIIVVKNYQSHGQQISKHSFVVLNDEGGQIEGLDYNLVCNVMSSFKDEKQREKKLSYPGNFPVTYDCLILEDCGNQKDGFIKAEQFYYFNKDKIEFMVLGSMTGEAFELLINFIENMKTDIEEIVDNL